MSVTEKANDIEMIGCLEVEPLHREPSDSPGSQARDVAQLTQPGRTHGGHSFDRFERRDRGVEHPLAQGQSTFLGVVARRLDQIRFGAGPKVNWLQRRSPRACFFS